MDNFEYNKNTEALLENVARLQPDWLTKIVGLIENTELGQSVIARNPDRRLYAILRPTPDEYLQRLRALLELADENTSMAWETSILVSLAFIKLSEKIGRYGDNGQISREVADDLTKMLWADTWIEVTNAFV